MRLFWPGWLPFGCQVVCIIVCVASGRFLIDGPGESMARYCDEISVGDNVSSM